VGDQSEHGPQNWAKLDEMRFVRDWSQHRFDTCVVPALRWYSDTRKGDMDVPGEFVMSANDCRQAGLPAHVAEVLLGSTVNNIRSQGTFVGDQTKHGPQNTAKLDEMQFAWFSARRGRPQQDP
jgi:hypothetical protein